jgi:hypothetical protein
MTLSYECIELIRTLGIPTIIDGISNNRSNYYNNMYNLARRNKVHLLYLNNNSMDNNLKEDYADVMYVLADITNILNENNIDYTVFKTLRPYPYLPSDIDILIDPSDIDRIERVLLKHGYSMFIKDLLCITFKKNDINVDLYFDPSVSDIPYLSRKSLVRHKDTIKINNTSVYRLADHAEFVAVMCHSFYKEQMFTINDYYTLTILAENSDINDIIALSKENNCLDILHLFSNICKDITLEVFDKTDLNICKIAYKLNDNVNDFDNIKAINIITLPYKFSIRYVIMSLFKKVAEEQGKINALKYFTKSISFKQIKKLVAHVKRETY